MYSALRSVCDPAQAVFFAAWLIGCAGIPGLVLRTPGSGQRIAAAATTLGACIGIPAALVQLLSRSTSTFQLSWGLPFGVCELALDPLSAFFLLPVFLITAAGSLYACGYWPAHQHRSTEPGMTFFYGIVGGAMAFLLLARHAVLFLMAWEVMALAAYFLLITEHELQEVRRAGTVYLIASHIGMAALLIFFSLISVQSGSLLFPASGSLSALAPYAAFSAVAAFVGFGAKAGIMPFHVWLPSAHANAPSHVSALMSGVLLKMGIYGLFRTASFFQQPPLLWGAVLTVAGISSALLGILFAMAQRDVKRLLACSSIENIGIITTGFGIALLGVSTHNSTLTYLGMAGSVLHILNHSLFKPLLFLGSGGVIHATATRDMNLMGGLGKSMPRLALLFMGGCVAICGIPPLNGFVSEFLLYLGFFSQLQGGSLTVLVLLAPVLALVGGAAAITFVKLYSALFLGTPRAEAVHGGDPGQAMLLPMAALLLLCLLLGTLPQVALQLVAPLLDCVAPGLNTAAAAREYAAVLAKLSLALVLLLTVAALVALLWRWRIAAARQTAAPTWGCGYQRGTARMQYGGTSFSELAVSVFNGIIGQRITLPVLRGLFPGASRCEDTPTETILGRIITPIFSCAGGVFGYLHRFQHGLMHIYILYIFATVCILMLWVQ